MLRVTNSLYVCATKKVHRASQIYSKNNSIRDIFCYITKLILRKIIEHQISACRFFARTFLLMLSRRKYLMSGNRSELGRCRLVLAEQAALGRLLLHQANGATARRLLDANFTSRHLDATRRRFVSLFNANFYNNLRTQRKNRRML